MCAASLWRWRSARAVPVKLLLKGIERHVRKDF
jgi:hypothetical protein